MSINTSAPVRRTTPVISDLSPRLDLTPTARSALPRTIRDAMTGRRPTFSRNDGPRVQLATADAGAAAEVMRSLSRSPTARPVLRRGADDQAAVLALQEFLTVAGHPVPKDGDFGPSTERAVVAFQRESGTTTDGIVGLETWTALENTARELGEARLSRRNESTEGYAALRGGNTVVGDQDARAALAQEALDRLGFEIETDGVFGPGSAAVVEDFQSRYRALGNHMAVDGVAGPATGVAILDALQWQIETGHSWARTNTEGALLAVVGTPAIEGTVGPGAPNNAADVRALQNRLRVLGYYQGSIDGQYGPQTEAALALATGVALGETNPVRRRVSPTDLLARRLWAPAMPSWVVVHKDNDGHSYGTSYLRDVVRRTEATFDEIREPGYRSDLPLGDASLSHGSTPDHSSHGTGLDIDIRMIKPNGFDLGSTVGGGNTDANAAVLASFLVQPEVGRIIVDWDRHPAFRARVKYYLRKLGDPTAVNKIRHEQKQHYHHLHIDVRMSRFGHDVR